MKQLYLITIHNNMDALHFSYVRSEELDGRSKCSNDIVQKVYFDRKTFFMLETLAENDLLDFNF